MDKRMSILAILMMILVLVFGIGTLTAESKVEKVLCRTGGLFDNEQEILGTECIEENSYVFNSNMTLREFTLTMMFAPLCLVAIYAFILDIMKESK